MFIQNNNDWVLPCGNDNIAYSVTEDNRMEWENSHLEIDGTGKLHIVNTGGTSAGEGGMGSGSEAGKEKGDLEQPLTGEKGGKPNADVEDTGWDPVKKGIDEATAKRDKDE